MQQIFSGIKSISFQSIVFPGFTEHYSVFLTETDTLKIILTAVFSLLGLCDCAAQFGISGRITGAAGQPLSSAGVRLQSGTGKFYEIAADSLGHFTFLSLQTDSIRLSVTYSGYLPYYDSFLLRADTTLGIVLIPVAENLSEVNVTASRAALENNPEKETFRVSKSITSTGNDLLSVIGKMPGIRVAGTDITVPGKGQLRVMINSRLIELSGMDLVRFLRSLTASQVDRIEWLRNPGAGYEAEGNAGLLNIILKHARENGLTGNFQFSGKQALYFNNNVYDRHWNAANAGGNLNWISGKWSAFGSINADMDHHIEGFRTTLFYPAKTWVQPDTGVYRYRNINLTAGLDYALNKNSSIGALYLGGRNVYPGSDHVNNPVYNKDGSVDSLFLTYATYYPVAINNAVNLHFVTLFDSSGKKLNVNGDYFNYYRTDHSRFESNSYDGNGALQPAARTRYVDTNKQNILVYTLKADLEIPTAWAQLSAGGKLSFISNYSNVYFFRLGETGQKSYDASLSNAFNYNENTQSVYVSAANNTGKWKWSAGVRGEYTQTKGESIVLNQTNRRKYFKPFPSLLISYQADSQQRFTISFNRRINRPIFWLLNPFKSLFTASSYGQGNPFLQPEYSSNAEIAHTYKDNLTSTLFFNATQNGFSNVTFAGPETNFVSTTPLNFISSYRYGITEIYAIRNQSWLENSNQVSLYHTDAKSALSYIKDIHGFGLYLSTNNTVWLNRDKTFAAAVNFWYQFPEVDHIGRADAYSKLDLGFTRLALKRKLTISLLFNDMLLKSAPTVNTTVNGIKQQFAVYQVNRYAQISLSYKFGNRRFVKDQPGPGNLDERGRAR